MFEDLEARARRMAAARVAARKETLAEQLAILLPAGTGIETVADGVLISGPGLGRRFVHEASLRWTIAGLIG